MIVKDIIDKYRKNDTKSKLVLVNLLVYQAKCVEAKFYLILLTWINFLKIQGWPAITKKIIIKNVKNNNPNLNKIIKIMDKNSDTSKTPA